jgi:hypothetical protein
MLEQLFAAIIEATRQGIPSGHLYAHLMTQGVTLENYNRMIAPLVDMGYITNDNHYLKATETGLSFAARHPVGR